MNIRNTMFRVLFGAECRRLEEFEEQRHETNAKVAKLYTDFQNKLEEAKRPPRARFDRYAALSEEGVSEALAGTASLPCMKAVMQLIDEKFQQASDTAGDPALADNETKFHLGGADWIVKLKAEVQERIERVKGG